jgi:LysR family transcriptional regulator, transcriptional activator of the cysJI operon
MQLPGIAAPLELSGRPAPSLYYLRTFQAVATVRSYTRAARALHLSQPAVSAHIRALERYYGARLFEVRQRRVFLTRIGEVLSSYTTRVFNLLGEADVVAAATLRGETGRVVVGASTTVGNYLLPTVLGRYRRLHPDVEVEVAIGTSRDVVGRVHDERVPFAIAEATVNDRELDIRPIGKDDMVLIVSRDHAWADTGTIAPGALERELLLRREPESGARLLVDAALAQAGIAPKTTATLASTEALKQAVFAGLGVAWVPGLAVRREMAAGDLVAVTVEGLGIPRTLSLITLRGAGLTAAAESLVTLIRRAAGGPRPAAPTWLTPVGAPVRGYA